MAIDSQPRLLVTGAGGQVGRELIMRGPALGFHVSGCLRSELDICDAGAISAALKRIRPDAVLNAAAYTAVDRAESEPEIAEAVNGTAAGLLAAACNNANIPLFHISTDYVFDGSLDRAYREDDPVNPIGAYGRSKAKGEVAIREATEQHIILRTAWVFSAHGNNFVKSILRLANERDELAVVDDQTGCPTYAGDIALTMLRLVKMCAERATSGENMRWGTYHLCNEGAVTWRGFADEIVKKAAVRRGRNVFVRGITTAEYPTAAKRPANSVLDCSAIETVFGVRLRPWHMALDEVLDELLKAGD
ncbi:MAG: dTDP-4-dehydrorhamnose reductase [Parvibaculum sp.]